MIQAMVLPSILNRHHILYILHHANRVFVTRMSLTYRTYLLVGDGMADAAVVDILLERSERRGKRLDILFGLAQKMQDQPQSSLATNARQRCKLINCFTKQYGWIISHSSFLPSVLESFGKDNARAYFQRLDNQIGEYEYP